MNKTINIDGCFVGQGCKPFIIAELSGNHQQSYDLALRMIEEAAAAGASAVKLQTYTADTMTLDVATDGFVIEEKESLWHGRSLHKLYQEASTPWEWHSGLFKRAKELGVVAFSSPFDETAVDFLETLDVPCYKVASFENTDLRLIRKIAETGKPIIMSTGMATLSEIEEAVFTARKYGCNELILLKCTSTYPASSEDTNLATLPHMSQTFKCSVGLSDHSQGIGIALAAIGLGAVVIEKHFVLDRDAGGVDAAFSVDPFELRQLVEGADRVAESVGQITYGTTKSDTAAKRYRRSLYISQNVDAGEVLTEENIRIIRPGLGLPSKYYDAVIGMKMRRAALKGTPISWELFKDE